MGAYKIHGICPWGSELGSALAAKNDILREGSHYGVLVSRSKPSEI